MSRETEQPTGKKCMCSSRPHLMLAALAATVGALGCLPGAAQAHGPVNPSASSFLARITAVPPGLDAKAVDGDQRLWLRAAPGRAVVVMDYRGAPYLRFSRAGVQVNQNSAMYYLNQTPTEVPPPGLGPATRPRWDLVSSGHAYEWHDGRLHALASTVIVPGQRFLGRWTIPLVLEGKAATIAGSLYYAPDPPLVWFWPIVVVLGCVFAGLRLRRLKLDWTVARILALVALVALTTAVLGQQLHGRPAVSITQLIFLVLELAFVAWGLSRLLLRRHGWFTFFVIAAAAIYEGATLIAVLLRGFVLLALPALIARMAVAACLASGAGLVPLVFRIAPQPSAGPSPDDAVGDEVGWEDESLLA
jgi:hypothetical protein